MSPADRAPTAEVGVAASAPLRADGTPSRVLVVDDERSLAEVLGGVLVKKVDAGREPMIHALRRAGYVLWPAP